MTNNYNIVAFGHEDKSHLTPELLTELIAAHAADTAVLHLVCLPTLGVFANKDTPSRARVYNGTGWADFDKEDTALRMAKGMTGNLSSHIEKIPTGVFKAEEYTEYYACLI